MGSAMTPERARRQMCWWIYAAVAIFAARWGSWAWFGHGWWVDWLFPTSSAWFCIAMAAWRRGFTVGWAGHRVAEALTKESP